MTCRGSPRRSQTVNIDADNRVRVRRNSHTFVLVVMVTASPRHGCAVRAPLRLARFWFPLLLIMMPEAHAGLQLIDTMPLSGIRGELGHMALDPTEQRLYVTGMGSDMLLELDLTTGKVIGRITDLNHPRGVEYLPRSRHLMVSNSGSGGLGVYKADTLVPIRDITFGGDSSDMCLDSITGRSYIGYGEGHRSGIAVIDGDGHPLAQWSLDSHPQGIAVDGRTRRLYVNLPSRHEIAVFNLATGKRTATWSLGTHTGSNFPLTLDSAHQRLFLATRNPDRLLVVDARSGQVLQTLTAPGDVGDLSYDSANGTLYASGGVGRIAVYLSSGNERLLRTEDIRTVRGAHTATLDAINGHYYLAVPAHRRRPAEIRVYADRVAPAKHSE